MSSINIDKKLQQLEDENRHLKALLNNNDESGNIGKAKDFAPVGYWCYDFYQEIFFITKEVCQLLELPKIVSTITPNDIYPIIHHSDIKKIRRLIEESVSEQTNYHYKLKTAGFDDANKILDIRAKLEVNSSGNPMKLYGSCIDVSNDEFGYKKHLENEKLLKSLFQNLTDIFVLYEIERNDEGGVVDYIYKEVNPVFEMKFGIKKEDIINKKLSAQPDLFTQLQPLYNIQSITNEPYQDNIFIEDLDSYIDILIYSPAPNIIATIWRDVSLSVKAKKTLKESEVKYRQLFVAARDGLILFDYETGQILEVNAVACNIFEYSKQQLQQILFKDLTKFPEITEGKIQDLKASRIFDTSVSSSGRELPIEIILSYFKIDGREVCLAAIIDATEQRKSQQQLINNERKFKELFNYSNDAVTIAKDYNIVEVNQKALEVFQCTSKSLINNTLWGLSPIIQDDGENSKLKVYSLTERALNGEQIQFEWIFQRNDKSIFYADVKLSSIVLNNSKYIQAIIRDISEIKKMELKLIEREHRWKKSLQLSNTGVWEWNLQTNETYFSPTWKRLIGYEKDEIDNNSELFFSRIHPDDEEYVHSSINNFREGRINDFNIGFRLRCKNGSYKWINSKGKIESYTVDGKPELFRGIHTDFTKYKLAELKLLEKNNKYEEAASLNEMVIWDFDLKTMLLTGSSNMSDLLEITANTSVLIKKIENIIHPEDQAKFISQFINHRNGHVQKCIFKIIVNSKTKFIASYSIPVYDSTGILTGYTGTFQNVSNYKQQELEFLDNQKLNNTFIQKSSQGIIVFQESKVLFTNGKIQAITGYSFDNDFSQFRDFENIVVPEDKVTLNNSFSELQNTSNTLPIEIRIETKYKKVKWLYVELVKSEYQNLDVILFIITDISENKELGREIEFLNTRNDVLFNQAINGICILNEKLNFLFCNDVFFNLTGIRSNEISKYSISDIFEKREAEIVASGIADVKGHKMDNFRFELKLKNNIYVLVKIYRLNYFQYENDSFALLIHDIDKEKKEIESLQNEKTQLQVLFNNSIMGIGLFDEKQNLILNNKTFSEIFKISTSDISQLNFEALGVNLANYKQTFKQLIAGNESFRIIHKSPDNENIYIEFLGLEYNNKRVLKISLFDVTKYYTHAKQLQEQLSLFQTIFKNAPKGIALIDKNRTIIECNERYASAFGTNVEQMKTIVLEKIVHTKDGIELQDKFFNLFSGLNTEFEQYLTFIDSDNNQRIIASYTSSFTDKYGEIIYAIQIVDDISDYQKSEYERAKKERVRTLNYLATSFSHKFNNYLMAMYGNAYLLKTNITDKQLCLNASTLFDTIDKAADLTYNLNSFTETTNKIDTVIGINKMIQHLLDDMVLPQSVLVDTHFEQTNDSVVGDYGLLYKAFQNIVQNSLEAINNSGEIIIETKTVYFDDEKTEFKEPQYLRISIEDNGCGINPIDLDKIFDPFFTTKQATLNTGLGLTVAQKNIEKHNGRIKVINNTHGTVFVVYVPQNEDSVKMIIQPNEQVTTNNTANIILIDDEDIVRIVTCELLRKMGYNVFSFVSGLKAIQFYKENKANIDMVILDKHMPEIDGVEVYNKLLQINHLVNVIMLTGFNVDDAVLDAFNKVNNVVIQKPVSVEKLSFAISKLLGA